jgi:hypothetical protein
MRRDTRPAASAVLAPLGSRLALVALAVTAMALVAAALTPVAAARAIHPATSAEFRLPASNGYTLDVKSEDGQLTVLAFREAPPVAHVSDPGQLLPPGEGGYAAATYYAPAADSMEAIDADLGALGQIHVSFQPSGLTRVTHLSQKGKTTDCVFPRRVVRRLGTFVGTISFGGEDGYTAVEATSAPGSLGTSPFRNCSTRVRPRRDVVLGQAGPDAYVDTSDPSAHLFFDASTLGPGVSFGAVMTEALPEGVIVTRQVEASAPGSDFGLDLARRVATLRPPAPFSGSATIRVGNRPAWIGTLAVAFPGRTVRLAGPSFRARMRLSN